MGGAEFSGQSGRPSRRPESHRAVAQRRTRSGAGVGEARGCPRGVTAPLPPADLAARTPRVVALGAGALVHRFFEIALDPIYFDPSGAGRFNAPDRTYGVLYVAQEPEGSFAETFLRTPGRRMIDSGLMAR